MFGWDHKFCWFVVLRLRFFIRNRNLNEVETRLNLKYVTCLYPFYEIVLDLRLNDEIRALLARGCFQQPIA